jgi:hypothetical protein
MSKPPLPIIRPTPRQLGIGFDSNRLWGMDPSERAKVLALLADLLMQAAGAAAEEASSSHDER